jgi:hypothetical protein
MNILSNNLSPRGLIEHPHHRRDAIVQP